MSTRSKKPFQLTPRQQEVLTVLACRQQWSVGEIAAALGVSSPAATKAVVRLESKGFVRRSENEMDRRRVDVRLTSVATRSMQFSGAARGDERSEEMRRRYPERVPLRREGGAF
jgi:predicted ArsR family transcriptional regulator